MDNGIILSICIPTYNRRDLVCENVQKILQYDGDDIEVIVNDNASEDGTVEALKQIGDKRLRIYQNAVNIGAKGNYMKVLMYATGKYVITVNDRDYVEHKDIQEFVTTYKDCEYDVIMCIDREDIFRKNVGQMCGRVYMFLYFVHPGQLIVGKAINEKIAARVRKESDEEYDEERNFDISTERCALVYYAEKWECYKKIIRQPKPEKLAEITPLRGETKLERNFFTPEARVEIFRKNLCNKYIHNEDMEMYVKACFRLNIYRSLVEFQHYRNDVYTQIRYNYEAETSVCWIKIAINFYNEAIKILKEKSMCTHRLVIDLGLITIEEYTKLCKIIIVNLKKRYFPKPWLKA